MIGIVLDILQMDDWYGLSKEMEIAKGKNELVLNYRSALKKKKRKKLYNVGNEGN